MFSFSSLDIIELYNLYILFIIKYNEIILAVGGRKEGKVEGGEEGRHDAIN